MKGKELIDKGVALIDTCGRTRESKEKNVIAIASKNFRFAVLYKSQLKKELFEEFKDDLNEKCKAKIHCVGIYHCLKDRLDVPGVYICADGFKKGDLVHYLKQFLGNKYDEEKIFILTSLDKMFGKKHIAHIAAKKVAKGMEEPNLILQRTHFNRYFKKV